MFIVTNHVQTWSTEEFAWDRCHIFLFVSNAAWVGRIFRKAHADHALHQLGRKLSVQDLQSQMQIVVRDTGLRQPRDAGWLGAEQRWTVGSLATSVAFVSSGLGFAWLPRHLIGRELAEGLLKPLPLVQGSIRRPLFYLYTNHDKPLGPATRILIELIKTYDAGQANSLAG